MIPFLLNAHPQFHPGLCDSVSLYLGVAEGGADQFFPTEIREQTLGHPDTEHVVMLVDPVISYRIAMPDLYY